MFKVTIFVANLLIEFLFSFSCIRCFFSFRKHFILKESSLVKEIALNDIVNVIRDIFMILPTNKDITNPRSLIGLWSPINFIF